MRTQSVEAGQRHIVCTVITPNYLPQFRVLGESIARTMPDADLRVLVLQDCADVSSVQAAIDDYLERAKSSASHRALTIDDCDWGDFDVVSAALFYSILEFATSVKPALLRALLRQGWDRATYLDPDIRVFADFAGLLDDDADLSLTPHFRSTIPRDDHRPSTYDVLMAGFFNLGFCSVRPNAIPFLDWWSSRLQFECLNDHVNGQFTDQKIVDMASLMTRVQVVTDPGANVAYWNLHERRVVDGDGGWAVSSDGQESPLYFFHYSGFRTPPTASMSVHSSRPVLGDAIPRRFAQDYADSLLQGANEPAPSFTLGGARLAQPIPAQWNRALRDDCDVHVRAGWSLRAVREQIYGPRATEAWTRCRSCGANHDNFGSRVGGFLSGWSRHPALNGVPNGIAAFFRTDHYEYRSGAMAQLSWATTDLASHLLGADGLAREILDVALGAVATAADIEVVGYLSSPVGIGQIARWTLATLEAAGIRCALSRVYAIGDSPEYLSLLLRRDNPVAATNASVLGVVNADQWEAHVTAPGRVNLATQHVEAVWAWELDHIPVSMYDTAMRAGVARVHALSHWSARAMARVLSVPVQRLSPFDLDLVEQWRERAEHSASPVAGPYVLTTFDAKSYLSRKNPEAVLEVWRRIVEDFPDHRLVIKSANLRDVAPAELLDHIEAAPRTDLIDRHLTDQEYTDLVAHCDVYVSLHRSEGMGLTPIEAGLCGRPVVYTNYGGVVDFFSDGFFPVAYELVRVGDSHHVPGPYDVDAQWAEPDLDDAERQVRRALTLGGDLESDTTLMVDHKKLVESLTVAQAEVVATAQRLVEYARRRDETTDVPLAERLTRSRAELEDPPPPPQPNRFLYAGIAVSWRLYKLLPAALRRQFNLSWSRVRSDRPGH